MKNAVHFMIVSVAVGLMAATSGCQTSSHRSVRTYDYNDEPAPRQQDRRSHSDEYEMQSPGEMVSPGQMVVDPDGERP